MPTGQGFPVTETMILERRARSHSVSDLLSTKVNESQKNTSQTGFTHKVGNDLSSLCIFAKLLGWQAAPKCILDTLV
ncbi:hypothetical protein INR49_017387 [Caranx melampygus]|nr:hypothetical protein INR49_017387 [Caranx melampygus]